ncbi:MAG: chorismate synthase [Halobacteriales archaeon]|nr:chorismate synthase [Halobacteriales archaeon]
MNSFGRRFRIQLFGESHGEGVGVVLDGVPPGLPVDLARLQADLDARRPGSSPLVSQRREPDAPRILSGTYQGRATGAPLCIWIGNRDAQPKPYAETAHLPRPGHADWTNHEWSRGHNDPRGGGHSSGRLTAPLVAAGSLAQVLLDAHGVACAAHLHQVGDLAGPTVELAARTMSDLARASSIGTAHKELEGPFATRIEDARRDRDSLGGIVAFVADGLPPALGDPFFDAVESHLAHLLFAVPAVKGVEFGAGFAAAAMRGSEHNDAYAVEDGRVRTATNHAGGILGGRTTGAPLRGRVAVKPASSLPGRPQETVDLATLAPATITTTGRHDPCIAVRAVPVVQACLRIVLADFVLQAYQEGHLAAKVWT